jgi:CDGSH-type Zn-finger protein
MTSKDDSRTEIRPYPDGPILVRGDFQLLDENGDPIPADRNTIALCRCGRTAIPPFCDGTHTLTKHPQAG